MIMGWRLAESLKTLRRQINELYPNRDRSSDGSIGDTSHGKRKSDHNPNSKGVVQAIDIDADLSPSVSVGHIVAALQHSRDKRIKYIIWNGQITVKGDVTQWKAYNGPNAHRHHAHVSVVDSESLYDDAREWDLSTPISTGTAPKKPVATVVLKKGDIGPLVVALQKALGIEADGDFGIKTQNAVIKFQISKGLKADGRAGDNTRKALGLI